VHFLGGTTILLNLLVCQFINQYLFNGYKDPGVGKTAIAEAIAQVLAVPLREMEEKKKIKLPELPKVVRNPFRKKEQEEANGAAAAAEDWVEDVLGYDLPKCPASLVGARLINVELASLVAGTSNRGDFEKKVKKLIEEATKNNVILFVDEIHNLIGTGGGGDGAMNAANLLKPALVSFFFGLGNPSKLEVFFLNATSLEQN
jgi:ATP-dependent Clp protease ATP-binding subunit ClpA